MKKEPPFWDARKLKAIGIGIAALLAISMSYVGVKALTKSSVKSPTNVASELRLTNPPSVPEVAQGAAPPTQSPETAALTLTNPATESNATQNVAPPNQDATDNAAAAQKQDAARGVEPRTLGWEPTFQMGGSPTPAPPAPAATPAATSQEPYRAGDEAIAHLGKANIAFNTPKSMAYGETRMIELVLHPSMSGPQLGRAINAEGPQEYAPIRASAQMEAYLTGDGFDITPITRTARQIVSNREVTKWSWDVRAKRLKLQRLHLSLQAVIEMNGKETSKTDVFDRDILVHITGFHSAALVAEDNWQLTAAVSTAFLGIIGWLTKKLLLKRATATA